MGIKVGIEGNNGQLWRWLSSLVELPPRITHLFQRALEYPAKLCIRDAGVFAPEPAYLDHSSSDSGGTSTATRESIMPYGFLDLWHFPLQARCDEGRGLLLTDFMRKRDGDVLAQSVEVKPRFPNPVLYFKPNQFGGDSCNLISNETRNGRNRISVVNGAALP